MNRRLDRLPDAELLDRSAEESQAFGVFYRRHEVLVLRYLMTRCRDPELAADLTAEAFAAAFEAADRFDPEQAGGTNALPWLLTIAMNTLRLSIRHGAVAEDARRRLECEPAVLEDAELARIEEVASVDGGVEELLATLPLDLREAIVARVLDERDYQDIAGELDSSQMVIRKRVSRGLSRLREALLPETMRKELP